MGALISKLMLLLSSSQTKKICIVGLDNAGKTTILYKLHLGQVVVTQPTIGSNVENIEYKNLKLEAWDLGGQESLRATWKTYYAGAHGIVMVVDSSDRERLALAREELRKIVSLDMLRGKPVLVFANKQDVKGSLSAAEVTDGLQLHSVKDADWGIQGCCAVSGQGLWEGVDWLVARLTAQGGSTVNTA